eukprot:TRINITY_DN446_c0_g1_i2.p1 TRINITY_DN446_c0_g1~~TRINITY_DN446_c0_g1_i2.p1  ORF type:complete len:206 (-),score=92.58 TRINITY_DN446_c0_g1_i2:4-621(-)
MLSRSLIKTLNLNLPYLKLNKLNKLNKQNFILFQKNNNHYNHYNNNKFSFFNRNFCSTIQSLEQNKNQFNSTSTSTSTSPNNLEITSTNNKKTRKPKIAIIQVTEAAAKRLSQLLEDANAQAVRVTVPKKGCGGLSYNFQIQEGNPGPFDEVIQVHGITIIVDANAIMHLLGSTLDFVNQPLSSSFIWQNPNAKGSCGCGESFVV